MKNIKNVKLYKKQIRERFLSIRDSIPSSHREEASRQICEEIVKTSEYKNASVIFMYYAVNSEVSLSALFRRAIEDGKIAAFPRCLPERQLEFLRVYDDNDFVVGTYNIPEPRRECESVAPSENALCIIPALAVDLSGTRLGYGGGYYDTFLSSNPGTVRMCVCFDEQVSDEPLPVGVYDENYKRLITERRKVFL